jgi:putative DNA primase/helicase
MTDEKVTDFDTILRKARQAKGQKTAGTRLGNIEDNTALEFARKHSDAFRYVAIWNRWMTWAADRWQHEETLSAFDAARVLCREGGDAKAKTVAAVVTLARTDRSLAAHEELSCPVKRGNCSAKFAVF